MANPDHRICRTGHVDLDRFLDSLRAQARSALGSEFIGTYVGGSLALGAFDRASDVAVVIATASEALHRFAALDVVHRRLARDTLERELASQNGLSNER